MVICFAFDSMTPQLIIFKDDLYICYIVWPNYETPHELSHDFDRCGLLASETSACFELMTRYVLASY